MDNRYDNDRQTKEEAMGRFERMNCPEKAASGIGTSRLEPSNYDVTSHHAPDHAQIQQITTIRAAARNFLDAIDANCPRCADATAAKRKVRDAMMTANASIVLNGMI